MGLGAGRRTTVRLIVLAGVAIGIGCGQSYSSDETPRADAGDEASSVEAAGRVELPSPAADGPCDPAEVPDAQGIFVSVKRGADANPGTMVSPVATVTTAIRIAAESRQGVIYVAEGDYDEPKSIIVRATQPLRIAGGWSEGPVQWKRACEPGRRLHTVLYVAQSPAFIDEPVTGAISLESLTVAAVNPIPFTRSSYAILLQGEGPPWNLSDVALVADRGRDGTAPESPTTAPAAGQCGQQCGDGAPGTPGHDGPAVPGAFRADGFVPGNGVAGEGGSVGMPGTPGGGGNTAKSFAGGCGTKTRPNCPDKTPTSSVASAPGQCGCAGEGGGGGGGGEGGGASIALYVSGSRSVRLAYTQLKTLGGGRGAPGAIGALGQSGGLGAAGAPTTYDARYCVTGPTGTNCAASSNSPQIVSLAGGSAGGPGGQGGAGGMGGPGAGGPSAGIVVVGGFVEAATGIAFEVGPAGESAPGAAVGVRSDRLDLDASGN